MTGVGFDEVQSDRPASVVTADVSPLRDLVGNVSGIFGQSLLGAGDYLIDYRKRRLVLDAPGALAAGLVGTSLPLEWSEGRPAILASIAAASGPAFRVRLVLDSGIERVTLFGDAARQLAVAARTTSRVFVEGPLGTMTAVSARGRLQAGGLTRDVEVTLLVNEDGRHEDGLLPTSLFRSVLVSAAAGMVMLDGEPKDRAFARARPSGECS